jgi:hypothetical protein
MVFVKTRFAKFPKSAWLISKSAPRLLKSAAWVSASFHLLGLGHHRGPLPLAVNSSYFALFSLIICDLDVFLDANCSSLSILAF